MAFGNPFHAYFVGLYPGTPAERALEPHIAALGVPYRTQFPYFIWGVKYFPDFLLPTLGIILEVDDDSHNDPEKQESDRQRTIAFEAKGWRVLRCTNEEALERPAVVIAYIKAFLDQQGALDLGLPPIPDYAKKSKRKRSRRRVAASRPRKHPTPSEPSGGRARSSPRQSPQHPLR